MCIDEPATSVCLCGKKHICTKNKHIFVHLTLCQPFQVLVATCSTPCKQPGIANLHFSAFSKPRFRDSVWHFESNNSMNQSTTATCNSNNYSDLMAHATRASSMSLLHVERRTSMDILPRSIWMQLVWCDHPMCSSRVKAMHRVLSSTLPLSMDQMDAAFVPQRTTHPAVTRVTSSLVRSSFGRTNLESLTQAVDNNII